MMYLARSSSGRVAQLGEHLLCKQGVAGSIPATSTNLLRVFYNLRCFLFRFFASHFRSNRSNNLQIEAIAHSFGLFEAHLKFLVEGANTVRTSFADGAPSRNC